MTAFITTTDEQEQALDEQPVSPRPVCWDEKVRARITPDEQYLYDFPFFAEMFNAMDAHYKQVDGCKWRLADFRSHEDVEEIYGTSDTRALEGHFLCRRYQVPLVGSGQRAVKRVECVQSYIRVVLFEEQYFKLQVLAKMLDRSAEAYNRTLRASPFDGILGTQLWNTLQQQRRNTQTGAQQQQQQHSPVPAPVLYTNALLDDAIEDQEKDEMIRFARTEVYERPRPSRPAPPLLSSVDWQRPPRERPDYKPVTRPLQTVLTYDSDLQRALEESLKTGRTHLAMQDQNREMRTWIDDDDEKGYVSPGDSSLAEQQQQREKSRRGAADDPDSARPDDRFFRPYENRPPLPPMAGASVIRERKPVTDLFGELTPSTKYVQPQHQSPIEEEEEEMDEDLRRAIEESLRFDPTSERRDAEEEEGDDERDSTTSTTSTTTTVHDTNSTIPGAVKKPVLHTWKPPRGLLNPPRGLPPGSAFKLPAPPPNTVPSLAHHFDQTDDEECQRAIEASLIAEQQRQSREKRLSESRKEREQQQQDDRPINIWEYIERRREKSERIVEDPSLLPDVIAEMRLEDEVLADSSLDQGGDDGDPLDQCFDELHPEEREWMLKALEESKHETGPSDTVLLSSPPTIAGDGDDPAASSWSSDNSAEEMGQRRTTQRKLVDSRDFKSRMSDLDAFHEQLKADAAKLNEQRVAKHNYKYNKTTSLSIVTHEVFTGILNRCTLFTLLRMVCVSRSMAERVDRLLVLYPPRSVCVESVCQLRQAMDGKWATPDKDTTARSILRHIRSSIATIRFQLSPCVRRNISYAWYPPPSDVEFKKRHDDRLLYIDRDTAVSFKSVLVCLQTYDDLDLLPHVIITARLLDVFIYVDRHTLTPNCAERFEALMAQWEKECRIRLVAEGVVLDDHYITPPIVIDDPGYRLWDSLDNGCH